MKLLRVTYEDPDMQLTKFVRSTTADSMSVFKCDNLKDYNKAQTTAYYVRRETREDGYRYKVSLDSNQMTVSVSLVK